MTAKPPTQKSLTEQILKEMFGILQKRPEFDTATIGNLRTLGKSGDLKKPAKVSEAIKPPKVEAS